MGSTAMPGKKKSTAGRGFRIPSSFTTLVCGLVGALPPLYGYGSIPIHTIFDGMNIHLPAILMFTRGTRS